MDAAAGPPAFGILGDPNAKIGSVWIFAFPLFVHNRLEWDETIPGSRDMTTMPNYVGKPVVIRMT